MRQLAPGPIAVAVTFLLGLGALLSAQEPVPLDGLVDERFAPMRFGDPDEHAYDAAFFPGANHDDAISTPDQLLGQRHATRLSHHAEIMACFRRWADESPRVSLHPYATSYEGRELAFAVITSPANHAALDDIRADLARLADPRGLDAAAADEILARARPVAWMGYSIHGDELSGADAAVAFGYHLIAGTDADVVGLLDEVVVVIDPVMNPDGRERIIAMTEQGAGYVASLDYASMHRGRWPWGRGNHYLFDLNRDWMAGVHPETRGRWRATLAFHPQLFVDGHEMGSLDTFLTYPQERPHNPQLPTTLNKWQKVFAADQGAAFDRYGWGYYTREWADGWGPFYSDAWGSLNGAVGILYEQSSTYGTALRRASGQVMTYRESVHHQAVSSLANVTTLREHRDEVLRDFLATGRRNVSSERPGNDRMFVCIPGRTRDREQALLATLLGQGLEVHRARDHLEVTGVVDTLGRRHETLDLPPGALLVPARQPAAPRVQAFLGFDPRIDAESLLEERRELERHGRSKMYDVTAWSLAHAFDVEAYWCDVVGLDGQDGSVAGAERVPATSAFATPAAAADAMSRDVPYAWVVDGSLDHSLRFAVRAMDLGLAVHVSDKAFETGGRSFPRGSLLVRRSENGPDVDQLVARASSESGVAVNTTGGGRAPADGPDLGGGHFLLLSRPRVALLSNSPVDVEAYGDVWHLLDHELGASLATLDAQSFGSYDLRRYNVIVIPSGGGVGGVLSRHTKRLEDWVRNGGTLIAFGASAGAMAGPDLKWGSVKRLRDVLEQRAAYDKSARRELDARQIELDLDALWGDEPLDAGMVPADSASGAPAAQTPGAQTPGAAEDVASELVADDTGRDDDGAAESDPSEPAAASSEDPVAHTKGADAPLKGEDAKREDAWKRRFAPQGVYLRAHVDDESWVTVGCGPEMPVLYSGSTVLMAREPVKTPVRLAAADELRLSGLVWPEARERIAHSAYLTIERLGSGQVILFVARPAFRGYSRGTARLFGNAVVYGPGAGARQAVGW